MRKRKGSKMFDGIIDKIFEGFDERVSGVADNLDDKFSYITKDLRNQLTDIQLQFEDLSEHAKFVIGACIGLSIVDTILLILILRRL